MKNAVEIELKKSPVQTKSKSDRKSLYEKVSTESSLNNQRLRSARVMRKIIVTCMKTYVLIDESSRAIHFLHERLLLKQPLLPQKRSQLLHSFHKESVAFAPVIWILPIEKQMSIGAWVWRNFSQGHRERHFMRNVTVLADSIAVLKKCGAIELELL